jgi:hypothetical protein
MPGKDRIMTRQINSIVGHFVAECNLDQKVTIIRDPRNGFKPVAFVPSVEKADVLQAIRRVGQKAKLEQSFELLGMQAIHNVEDINFDKAQDFIKRNANVSGSGTARTKVKVPLGPGGTVREPAMEAPPPPKQSAKEKKAAPEPEKSTKKIKRAKAPGKKVGAEHGW